MTKFIFMSGSRLEFRKLHYFAVVAEEGSLHRAAERLFISQPPLSRHIRQFEEELGFSLFVRHSKGVTLTEEGKAVLERIGPLLALHETTREGLNALVQVAGKRVTAGFTTAFEQGLFSKIQQGLQHHYGPRLHLARESSPRLVRDVRKGTMDFALVALPLATEGLTAITLGYNEPLVAVLPATWPEACENKPPLRRFNSKPLFWFRRESNPAFYDFARGIFTYAGYTPIFFEEPAEHDVLLARIASGEGMGLFPASFSAIKREGVVFIPVKEGEQLQLSLGLVMASGDAEREAQLVKILRDALY